MENETIVFNFDKENFKLKLSGFPELKTEKEFIKKAIEKTKKKFPTIIKKISKEVAISKLKNHKILIIKHKNVDFKEELLFSWILKEKRKRILYILTELILMPFSGILAILPGPNVFFYSLFLLFYFHLKTYISLSKVNRETLKIEVKNEDS